MKDIVDLLITIIILLIFELLITAFGLGVIYSKLRENPKIISEKIETCQRIISQDIDIAGLGFKED